jgi:hypothetical protein
VRSLQNSEPTPAVPVLRSRCTFYPRKPAKSRHPPRKPANAKYLPSPQLLELLKFNCSNV